MQKERSRWEIILDILKVIQDEENVKKTLIMQKASLDWRNFKRYSDFLVDEGFIAMCKDSECYAVTDKGGNFLIKLSGISEMFPKDSKQFEQPAKIFS